MADYTFKVIVIGEAGVGKTAIVRRFIKRFFPDNERPTIGIDIGIKLIEMDGKKIQLKIWDSAGSERFRSLATSYYRNADAVILVYSINDSETLYKLQTWSKELNNNDKELVKILVGNKNDLENEREVSQDIAINFALLENMDLAIECSAKNDENINYLFYTAAKHLLTQHNQHNTLKFQNKITDNVSSPVKNTNNQIEIHDTMKHPKKQIFRKFCSIV